MSSADKFSLWIGGAALVLGLLNTVFIFLQHRRENKRYAQDQKDRDAKIKQEREELKKTVVKADSNCIIYMRRKIVCKVSELTATMGPEENAFIGFYISPQITFYNESKTAKSVKIKFASVRYRDGGKHILKRAEANPVRQFNIEPLKSSEEITFMYIVDENSPADGYPDNYRERADLVEQFMITYEVIGQGEKQITLPIDKIDER